MKKLAIIATHPVQYYAPLFALLAKEPGIELKVFYTWSQKQEDGYDPDFKINIAWDIPLLEGYDPTFVPNTAKRPGAHHFMGIVCPLLIEEIEQWGATHLLVFGWNFHAHLTTMRHFKGKIPVWFRGDSTLLDYDIQMFSAIRMAHLVADCKQFGKFLLRKLFLTWVYRYVDKAFYVGQNNKTYYLAHGVKEQQLVFAPHAIDNERFFDTPDRAYETRAKQWRRELNIADGDLVLLYAGKFEPRKNLGFFLEAYNSFCKRDVRLKLILLGNGPLEKEIKDLALKNSDRIILLPFQNQSQMPVVYRLADFYCLPSRSETWGLAVNEALACGRPVLVSHKVGCAEDLVNADTGRIFQSGNMDDLGLKFNEIITSCSCFQKESLHGFIANWSFEVIVQQIVGQLNCDGE